MKCDCCGCCGYDQQGVDSPGNDIFSYFHCKKCLEELPKDQSPKEYSRTQFGWTKKGFQIWCNRHDMNVGNFDLMGNKVKIIEDFQGDK